MKEEIEKLIKELNEKLDSYGLEVDNHCEFISVIKRKSDNFIVAKLYDNNDIDWIE